MTKLEEIIIDRFKERAAITFAEFMDLALYYPELGYYSSTKPKIGKEGDFFTSPDVHPLFGKMVGKRIKEMVLNLESEISTSSPFKIVEFGAGKGLLAFDILKFLKEEEPELFAKISYFIIDVSPSLIEKQKETLADLSFLNKVTWLRSWEEFKQPIIGCILSNELIDAFPVHRVQQCKNGLQEIFVTYEEGNKEWKEILLSPSSPELVNYFSRQNLQLTLDQQAEVNLNALGWLEDIAAKLKKGFILTIDYGFLAKELYADYRAEGTLVCYYKHQLIKNPYLNIGQQDITAHVNFSALMEKGQELGLVLQSFTTQNKFLLDMGIIDEITKLSLDPLQAWQAGVAAKKLIMPGGMGDIFKVLILEKF